MNNNETTAAYFGPRTATHIDTVTKSHFTRGMAENNGVLEHGIEITNQPPLHLEMSRAEQLRKMAIGKSDQTLRRVLAAPREKLAETLKYGSTELKKDIREKYPSYPDARLEMLLDLTFGFGRLPKDMIMNPDTKDLDMKDLSARLQHELTHEIAYAAESDDPNYIDTTYSLVRNLDILANKFGSVSDTTIARLWKGMRNELAIVSTLHKNGYRVFLPDYAQDPTEIPNSDNEVMQLDVRGGIDLIAVSPKREVLLIDAKGRRGQRRIAEQLQDGAVQHVDLSEGLKPLVAESIVSVAQACGASRGDVWRMNLVLPTEGRSFVGTDFLTDRHEDTEKQRQSLARFGMLKSDVQNGIMQQIDLSRR